MDALPLHAAVNQTAPCTPAERVLFASELWYPPILLLAFIVSAASYSILTSRSEEELDAPTATGPGGKPLPITKRKSGDDQLVLDTHFGVAARRVFQYLTAAVVLTFIADFVTVLLRALRDRDESANSRWWCGEERIVYIAGCCFFYVYFLITLVQWHDVPNLVHCVVWALSLFGETIILLSSISRVSSWHCVIDDFQTSHVKMVYGLKRWDLIDLGIATARLALFVGLLFLYTALVAKRYRKQRQLLADEASRSDASSATQSDSDEDTPLLTGRQSGGYHTQDGSSESRQHSQKSSAHDAEGPSPEEAAFYRPEKLPHKTWFEYCRGYSVFFPYLWPSKSTRLQIVVLICVVLVMFQRAVNVLVPYQLGVVTNQLKAEYEGTHLMPWIQLCLLILYKLLQGQSGLIGSVRAILWVPVSQHTYRALTTAAFEHVHSLSLDFHLGKRTGEVLSALNKGAAINTFLEQVTFFVLPMVFDLFVAIVFFHIAFGPMYSLCVSVITFYYLYVSVQMAQTRVDQRRDMVNADREEEAVKNDSITSYETVKYFNAEEFEFKRYREAIRAFQAAEAQVTMGIQHMNMAQASVFMFGIFVTLMICGFEVTRGTRTVGEFVLLITYLNQLQGPLNFFGSFYRTIQQAMISGERLLELFKIRPNVVDKPGARDLKNCRGNIRWNKVKFSYDRRRSALRDLSFECAPGTTTAFVGESGGGKSTIFRLMFRYYNCQEGSIEIDGQDVKDVTIDSVRRFIGVVPQDTLLFNESLMYNLKYANQNATDEDVYDACRAAAIHDRIMGFPDGYNTRVGERGLRLSGGEKQRVAIARTILKKPKIIMLDEATSALDGETEQKIQSKLISGNFGQQDRTLLIIAHRLSTITHADQIVVLHAGTIIEKGTHEELLAMHGKYATMWDKHCRAEKAVHAARVATTRANKLLAQANISNSGPGQGESDGYASTASSTIIPPGQNTPGGGAPGSQRDDASIAASSSSSPSDEDSNDSTNYTAHGSPHESLLDAPSTMPTDTTDGHRRSGARFPSRYAPNHLEGRP